MTEKFHYIHCSCHSIDHMVVLSYDEDDKKNDIMWLQLAYRPLSFLQRLKVLFSRDPGVAELVLNDKSLADLEDYIIEFRN